MNKTVNKIIAREGLIIIGIVIFGSAIFSIGNALTEKINLKIHQISPFYKDFPTTLREQAETILEKPKIRPLLKTRDWTTLMRGSGFVMILFGYPLYLLVHFIVWAVKTLRER